MQHPNKTGKTHKYICIDCSGSTNYESQYWQLVAEYTEKNPTAKFVLWNHSAEPCSSARVLEVASKKHGTGGTSPSCFAGGNFPEHCHLVIFTDGQVDEQEVASCERILKGKKFERVEMHFVNTGGEINLSVSTPFTRNTEFQIFVDGKLIASGDSGKEIDLSQYYDNPQKFLDDSEQLLHVALMQNNGRVNQKLRDEILDLQKNLLNHIAKSKMEHSGQLYTNLREALVQEQLGPAMELMQEAINANDNTLAQRVELVVTELLKHTQGKYHFGFNALDVGRLRRAETVDEVELQQVEIREDEEGPELTFECPILLDTDLPVLMINSHPPILEGVNKSCLNNVLNNPLAVLVDNELKQRLLRRLDHVMGLATFVNMHQQGPVMSPFTRERIGGVLCFSEHPTHTQATIYALSRLFFGTKMPTNPLMCLAAVYFAVQEKEYLRENGALTEIFTKHLVKSFQKTHTNITLCGLPIRPFMKAPMDLSIWYCVVSPHFFSKGIGNRLRMLGTGSRYLVQLLELLGYPFDRELVATRLLAYEAFAWMMSEEKKGAPWRNLLHAQYQNSCIAEGQIVLLDGRADPQRVPHFPFSLPLAQLLGLAALVDRQKKEEDIVISFPLQEIAPRCFHNWLQYDDGMEIVRVPICPATFRPYYFDPGTQAEWKVPAEKAYGPVERQLSMHNYFIRCVRDQRRYPTQGQFILYLQSKVRRRTLPSIIERGVAMMYEEYEKVLGPGFAEVDVDCFIRIAVLTAPLSTRILLETSYNPKPSFAMINCDN